MTGEMLTDHEVQVTASVIEVGKGTGALGKVTARIVQLRNVQHTNYCNRLNTDFKRLMKVIEVYCYLANLKFGIWAHYYVLLKLSGKSPAIVKGMKSLMDSQKASDRRLLEFMVYPSKETAIIHYLGDIEKQSLSLIFFELRGIKEEDLSFLCEGQYRLSAEKYNDSRLYMANLWKVVRWNDTPKENKSKFSFKKVNGTGNCFHIYSERFPGYYVRKAVNGFWVEGGWGSPSVAQNSTWKIVPVNVEGKKPIHEFMYAMLAPKDTQDIFLFAGFSGRVGVQKFTEDEFEQVLWKITKVKSLNK